MQDKISHWPKQVFFMPTTIFGWPTSTILISNLELVEEACCANVAIAD